MEKRLYKTYQSSDYYMVMTSAEMMDAMNTMMNTMMIVLVAIAAISLLVGGIGIMNIMLVSVTERTREIATLKVLGFYDNEVSAYIYRESIILTILGTGLGLGLGVALTRFVVATAEVDSIMFGRSIYFFSFLMAAVITFLFSFLVNWVMHYRLKKIGMVESMKSVD